MSVPVLSSRIEQSRFISGFWIKAYKIIEFQIVASKASKTEVLETGISPSSQGNNVINLHRDNNLASRLTILTAISRALRNLPAQAP